MRNLPIVWLCCIGIGILFACGENAEEEKQKQQVTHKENTNPVASEPVTLT